MAEETKTEETAIEKEEQPGEEQPGEKAEGVVEKLTAEELVDKAAEKFQSIKSQSVQAASGQRGWSDLSDQEISHILANPNQYQGYIPGAIAENNRRIENSVLGKVEMAFELKTAQAKDADAFDPNTPLGKEVSKIVAKKSYGEVLSDAIELAAYRTGKNKNSVIAGKKILNNLKAASTMGGGTDSTEAAKIQSPSTMSKADFNEIVKQTKLRT